MSSNIKCKIVKRLILWLFKKQNNLYSSWAILTCDALARVLLCFYFFYVGTSTHINDHLLVHIYTTRMHANIKCLLITNNLKTFGIETP